MTEANSSAALLRLLKPRLPQMLSVLRTFVLAESPSLEKSPADRCCAIIAAEWRKQGARVQRLAQKHRGDHLRITWPPQSRPAGQLLVLGHYDTVYATGALAKMPFRLSAGKAYGPGTFDMKAGIVQALFALQALRQAQTPLRKRIVFLWTSDEEIGSESSRKLIEAETRGSDAVFVLEPSFGPRGLRFAAASIALPWSAKSAPRFSLAQNHWPHEWACRSESASREAARTEISPRLSASRRSMAWAQSAMARTPRTSMSS